MATRSQSAFSRADRVSSAYLSRPFSAPSPGRISRRYSVTIQTFLNGPAADVLRVRLRQAAHFRNATLIGFLHAHQNSIINALSRQKGLIAGVFPQDNSTPKVDGWSFQLLCIVLRASGSLTVQEINDVTFLEKCYRCHFRMRPQSTSAKCLRPKREWIQVCSAVQRLVENTGDPVLIKTVRNFICKVEMGPKKVQAHRDMQRRLYETLLDLISNNPDSKYAVHKSEGNIIEKKMKELSKLKQTYEDLGSRPATVSWTRNDIFDDRCTPRQRMVSSVSFQSPYETNNKSKDYKSPRIKPTETPTLQVKREEEDEIIGRISPYAGKDISSRVAYQRELPKTKPVTEYRILHKHQSGKTPKLPPVLYIPHGSISDRKPTRPGNGESIIIKQAMRQTKNKLNSTSSRKKPSISGNRETVSKNNTDNTKVDNHKAKHGNEPDILNDDNIGKKPQHKSVKATIHNKIKRTKSNLTADHTKKSNKLPTLKKVHTSNEIKHDSHKDDNPDMKSNKNKRSASAKQPKHDAKQTTKEARPTKQDEKQQKQDVQQLKQNTKKPVINKSGKFKKVQKKITEMQQHINKPNNKLPSHKSNKHINIQKTSSTKRKPDQNVVSAYQKYAHDDIHASKENNDNDEKHNIDVTDPNRVDMGQNDLSDRRNIITEKSDNEMTVNHPEKKTDSHVSISKSKNAEREDDISSNKEQKPSKSKKRGVESLYTVDDNEMKKVAMEILVHQNIQSVVNHRLFQSKDNIDQFFDFLYKHQVMKKFLKSPNSEPYKQWDNEPGTADGYFYFLHCFIFRHIDPNKDKAALYVVEKVLTRMQCQHLRTPRPKSSIGSMFKNRKSLLMEAIEYSRNHTQPGMKNKSPRGSRSNSPQNLSKSYTARSSSPKPKSYLPVPSRSLTATPRLPAPSSRCWKCKQKDLAMKISLNWGNKCICDLLLKEGVHYKMEHLLPAVKVNSLYMLSDIVNHLKERQEWDSEDKHAKDSLHEAKKLRITKIVDYLEGEGIDDDRQVRRVCLTCLF